MENLALQSVKELRNIATEKGIELPKRAKKEEILELLSAVLDVKEETSEEFNWETANVNRRTIAKLSKEELLTYPGFAENVEAFSENDEKALVAIILEHQKAIKKANDPATIAKAENLEEVTNLIDELSEAGSKKLTKEDISKIRKTMQGKSFTKDGRSLINEKLDAVRMKMHDKFELEEFKDYANAELKKGTVTFDGGSMSQFEFLVRIACRDFGEAIAYELLQFEQGKIKSLEGTAKADRYTEVTYESLLALTKQDEIVEAIEELYDVAKFPVDYNQLNLPTDVEIGGEVAILDVVGKVHKMRVVQHQPAIVQIRGNYFMGDTSILDKAYWTFKEQTLTKAEVFEKYADEDYLENKYNAEKDPAATPEYMSDEV